ncbi:MAG: hypothetical protein HQ527_04395 [Cyanobacteria bacterium]|nr:hypothetical protein [Cyanobacteria bacterium bin.51]
MTINSSTMQMMPTASAASEDQAAVDERLKQSILDKRQVDIEAWDLQIEQFRSSLNGLAGDVQQVAQDRLDELVQARDQSVEQLNQLRQTTQDNVEGLLEQTKTSFEKLADEFKSLVDRGN